MSSAVATTVAVIQAKHENKMLSIWEMIEKSFLLRDSLFATPSPNADAISEALLGDDSLPKASSERWNQPNLGYFGPHLDKANEKGEIVSVGKTYTTETLCSLYSAFKVL